MIWPQKVTRGTRNRLADAANTTLCFDGQRLPVLMEGDYKALEKAYLQANPQPGQPLLVSLEGLITQRPSMEEHNPPQTTLVVERFIAVWPGGSCDNKLTDSPKVYLNTVHRPRLPCFYRRRVIDVGTARRQ